MSGVSEISENLTNYGISCHPETGTFREFPISLFRSGDFGLNYPTRAQDPGPR
jgi:hypothetical protein